MAVSLPSLSRRAAQAVYIVCPRPAPLPSDFTLTRRTGSHDLWQECFSELLTFRDLQDDWDGLGAKAPFDWAIRSAIELAENLRQKGWPAPGGVIPGITGTVLFEWQNPGLFIELEVTSQSSADQLVMRDGQPPWNSIRRW
jgi:hypothetical protein